MDSRGQGTSGKGLEQIRVACLYEGHVQGVGFRYTAVSVAAQVPGVTGFVRNLPDGDVEVLIEGPPMMVETFLQRIAERMGRFIVREHRCQAPATGEFGEFAVR